MATVYGMTLLLRDEAGVIERYRAEHAAAWPQVVACLHRAGIRQLRIFLRGRRLFMFLEVDDGFEPSRDFAALNEDAVYREWDELMRSLQEPVPEAAAGEWWAEMEEVFDLGSAQLRAAPGEGRG